MRNLINNIYGKVVHNIKIAKNIFENLKIFQKLMVILAVVVLVYGMNSIYSIMVVSDENNFINNIYRNIYTPNTLLTNVSIKVSEVEALTRDHIAKSTITEKKQIEQKIQGKLDEINASIQDLTKQNLDESSKQLLKSIETQYPKYSKNIKELLQLSNDRKEMEAYANLYGDNIRLNNSLTSNINKFVSKNVEQIENITTESNNKYNNFILTLSILSTLTILVLFFSFFMSARTLSKRINKLVSEMQKAEKGDVNIIIENDATDEIGILANSVRIVADNIRSQAYIAEKIANGDLNTSVNIRSENDIMSISMNKIIHTLKDLESETEVLVNSSIHGYIETRGKTDTIQGGFKRIVLGFNKTLDILVGFINAIPSPILIVDSNLNISYVNKACLELLNKKSDELLGINYYEVASGFKIERYTCEMAMELETEVKKEIEASFNGKNYEFIDVAIPLFDNDGKVIGCFELITDQTEIKKSSKKMQKILDYQFKEIDSLTNAIGKLSTGDLNIELESAAFDDDTKEIFEVFSKLANSINLMSKDLRNIIKEISNVLVEISNKNLLVGFSSEYKGDFANISDSIYVILESLNDTLGEINNSANQVSAGSIQVSDGSQSLAQGATEQASVIEELTASLVDISSQTKDNAVNANQANQIVINAKTDVDNGTSQMHDMVKAMNEISKVSSKISKVISFIDEIAFQTNILALNASVEAARVGQYGKGFSVVAQEVKKLAGKSAEAAKETADMIESSIEKINQGTLIANNTAKSLDIISDKIGQVVSLISGIATASSFQATAIAQINNGIEQVSKVVQTNSATSEESAAASQELSSQAKSLENLVSQFKIDVK